MKSVQETRRQLFEQHMSIPESVTWDENTKSYTGQNFWLVDYAWEAFNAALDVVEIELPALKNSSSYYDGGDVYDSAINQCRYKIEALNLGIKIK